MRDFGFLIHDRRFAVPTLELVSVNNLDRAREPAKIRLAESPHHAVVDVLEDGLLVFGVGPPETLRDQKISSPASLSTRA